MNWFKMKLPITRQEKFGELVRLMLTDPNQCYPGLDLAKEADQETINYCLKRLLAAGHVTSANELVAYRQGAPALTHQEIDIAVKNSLGAIGYGQYLKGCIKFFTEIGYWSNVEQFILLALQDGDMESAKTFAEHRSKQPQLTLEEIGYAIENQLINGDVHSASRIAKTCRPSAPELSPAQYETLANAIIKSGCITHINSVFSHVSRAKQDEAIQVAINCGYDAYNLKRLLALRDDPPKITAAQWSQMVAVTKKGSIRYLLRDLLNEEGGVDEDVVCQCIRKMVQCGKDFHLRDEVGENQAYYNKMTLKMKDCYIDANIDAGRLFEAELYLGYGCFPETVDKLVEACIAAGDLRDIFNVLLYRKSAPQLSDEELTRLILVYKEYLKHPKPVDYYDDDSDPDWDEDEDD